MSIYQEMLLDEMNRLNSNISSYQKECDKMPKGSLILKKINGRKYWYLAHREKSKVKTIYICSENDDAKLNLIRENIKIRKEYENIIKNLKNNKKQLISILKRAER